ncbi:hypothetical protein RFI_39913 [Reticulomyxa filosa]|uniref:Uncharacterized protein n=1 Tax=Reticulomyxa filosa TaxID=46433 RepID=X6L919_RETFI|nr:hypothetical protein RFI_39913 [Reticulomyxa filosa]|eukprot:ETN97616.1 hypothetical protein RFI_39913 [Reticulomyxa filosa]
MELNLRAKFQTWNPSIQCEDPKCPSRDVLLYLKNVLYETSYWDNRTYCFHKNAYNAYIQWKRHLELQKHDQNTTMLLSSEEFPRYVKQCVDESIQAMYRPVKTYDRFAVNFDDTKRTSEVQVFEVIKNFKSSVTFSPLAIQKALHKYTTFYIILQFENFLWNIASQRKIIFV